MPTTLSSPPDTASATPVLWRDRCIAMLTDDGIYKKTITKRNQWCRRHDAPGIQAIPFDSIRRQGRVRRVEVINKVDGSRLSLSVEDFEDCAIRDTLRESDGEQLFAPAHCWHTDYSEGFQFGLDLNQDTGAGRE